MRSLMILSRTVFIVGLLQHLGCSLSYAQAELILLTAKSDLFHLALDVKRIELDFSNVKSADIPGDIMSAKLDRLAAYKDSSFVKKIIRYDAERAAKSQLKNAFSDVFKINSAPFKALLMKYKPIFIARTFDAPFDTLEVNHKGRVVSMPDMSIHYTLYLSDIKNTDAFVKEASAIQYVISCLQNPRNVNN